MEKLRFIKDHSSKRFKKGQVVEMPKENVAAWIASGFCVLDSEEKIELGNVNGSMKKVSDSKENLKSGTKSQKKLSKNKKK